MASTTPPPSLSPKEEQESSSPTSTSSSTTLTSATSSSSEESNQVSKTNNSFVPDYIDISKHLKDDPMGEMLTDTHIENFCHICVDYFSEKEDFPKFRCFNPTFFESNYDIEDSSNFVTGFDPDIPLLFIPICFDTHWVLFVLRPQMWILESFNSLEHVCIPSSKRMRVAEVCKFLFNRKKPPRYSAVPLPLSLQQRDGTSCGVFVCVFIEQIIRYDKICAVINFNILEERLRLDWIFFEVSMMKAKPTFWPTFSGNLFPVFQSQELEDSEEEELDFIESSDEDDENMIS